MKSSPPPADRRKFTGDRDEIGYLYDKLLYWLYHRGDSAKANPYANRLERLLAKADPKHDAILGDECWSLIYEAKGEILKAIKNRENEIRKMRRLHEISRDTPRKTREFALRGRGYADLSDRLDLLATLFHEAGYLDNAISVLQESKQLCKAHRIKFDGADILQDCLEEKQQSRKERDSVNGSSTLPGQKRMRA